MCYVPVDTRLVDNLWNMGAPLYDNGESVTNVEKARQAAMRGTLKVKADFAENEVSEYIKTLKQISELEARRKQLESQLLDVAHLALCDPMYHRYELATDEGVVQLYQEPQVTVKASKGELLFELLRGDDCLVQREVSFKISASVKRVVDILTRKAQLRETPTRVAEQIIAAHHLNVVPYQFLVTIGSSYDHRVDVMLNRYKFSREEAHKYAYLLDNTDNVVVVEHFLESAGLTAADRKLVGQFVDCFEVTTNVGIAVRTA